MKTLDLDKNQQHTNLKIGIAFLILICVQFGAFPWMSRMLLSSANYNNYANYVYFRLISIYAMILVGIYVFRVKGSGIFLDHFSLWLILLSSLLRVTRTGNNESLYELCMTSLGIILFIYILINRKNLAIPSPKLILIGILWAIGTALVLALITLLFDPPAVSIPSNLSNTLPIFFVYNLSEIVIIEEVCFRGLFVGSMLMMGYKENTAFIVQAILFWVMHYARIGNPVSFFVIVPLLTFVTSMLMKKYRMLFLPILVHLFVNTFMSIIVAILSGRWAF